MDDFNKFDKIKRVKLKSLYGESLYKVQKDNLWGIFCDKKKRLIVPIEFKDIEAIEIELKYIDDYNNRVWPYETIIYKVHKNNLWGLYISKDNNIKNDVSIPVEFEQIIILDEAKLKTGLKVKKNKSWGLYHLWGNFKSGINIALELTIPIEFNQIESIKNKEKIEKTKYSEYIREYIAYKVQKNNLWGLYDEFNPEFFISWQDMHKYCPTIPVEYEQIEWCKDLNFIYKVKKNNLFGVYKENKLIIPIEFTQIQYTSNYYIVKKENKFKIYDNYEKLRFNDIDHFEVINNNFILIKRGKEYGFCCEGAIEPKFDEVIYKGRYILVKKNGYYGLLNEKCHLIIPIQYEEIQYKEIKNYGTTILYIVCKRNKYGLFKYIVDSKKSSNETTIEIIPFIYDNIQIKCDKNPYLIVRTNGLYGLRTIIGDLFIPIKYEEVEEIKEEDCPWEPSDRSYLIKQNNKYGIFRRKFEIIPCIFDSIKYNGYEFLCKYNNHIYKFNDKGLRNHYGALEYLRTDMQYNSFCNDKNSADLINYDF